MTTPHDKTTFLHLYSRHYFDIFRFVTALEPNRSDAEDIMQEISVALWEKFDRFEIAHGDFPTWARGFVRFGVLKHRRAHARRKLVLDDDLIERLADEHAAEAERLAAQRSALQKCLESLGNEARQLVATRYEMKHGDLKELAKTTGKSSNALSIALYKIRQQLIKCTDKTLETEGWA